MYVFGFVAKCFLDMYIAGATFLRGLVCILPKNDCFIKIELLEMEPEMQ